METNNLPLRDLCAASLSAEAQRRAPAMDLALSASFGSVERWREAFIAAARSSIGPSGWLLLSFDPRESRLMHEWAADEAHASPGGVPLLAMDRNEAANVDAFVARIAWAQVYERYQQAVTRASEGLGITADDAKDARLIDVRRAGVFAQADAMAEGAEWQDPALVDAWAKQLPSAEPVLVYCVYGHEVGRSTAMRLRAAGIDARFLIGGFDGWRSEGRPIMKKPAP